MFTYVQGDREYRMLATEATYSTNQLLTGRENQTGFKNSLLLTAKKSKTELLFFSQWDRISMLSMPKQWARNTTGHMAGGNRGWLVQSFQVSETLRTGSVFPEALPRGQPPTPAHRPHSPAAEWGWGEMSQKAVPTLTMFATGFWGPKFTNGVWFRATSKKRKILDELSNTKHSFSIQHAAFHERLGQIRGRVLHVLSALF